MRDNSYQLLSTSNLLTQSFARTLSVSGAPEPSALATTFAHCLLSLAQPSAVPLERGGVPAGILLSPLPLAFDGASRVHPSLGTGNGFLEDSLASPRVRRSFALRVADTRTGGPLCRRLECGLGGPLFLVGNARAGPLPVRQLRLVQRLPLWGLPPGG